MGCFSFICKNCGKAILSNSFRGQPVELFLLKAGEVVEHMSGEYDSYGRVFDADGKSIKWSMSWSNVCELMFMDDNHNGILAIHTKCMKEGLIPDTRSENDPNQGWGDDWEYFSDTDTKKEIP
jgi:hypothetical protein